MLNQTIRMKGRIVLYLLLKKCYDTIHTMTLLTIIANGILKK